ncbi:TSUP family transporter [Cupriavidus sp. TMH.W2]|uniref:TSUP family transporter n=1 Tax=Cupriavidus sp. TMH.W2 TaxID=3434465 RepID=UPI003D77EB47
MSVWQHGLFLLCVGLATFTQNLTGFAFGLVLLGLVAQFHLVPLTVAANVVTVMVLVNAAMVVRRWPRLPSPLPIAILLSSLVGVATGVWLLSLLSDHAMNELRVGLGLAILVCSSLLILKEHRRERISTSASFALFGWLSGVMGGLFASAGPPMVFHMYRQPLKREVIQETLVLLFAVNAVLRLLLVAAHDSFDMPSARLSLEALPVVLGLTWMARRYPPRWSPASVRRVVFVLLLVAGGCLVVPTLMTLVRSLQGVFA